MLMMHGLAIVIELLIGMVVGFYFTDRKKGLSFNDVKIASIMFLTLHAILLVMGNVTWLALAHMITAFIALFGGVLIGEYLRISLARRVVDKTIRKEHIYQTIKEFVENAELVAIGAGSPEELSVQLELVKDKINQARLRVNLMKQSEIFHNLNQISDTCETVAVMSIKMRGSEDIERYRSATYALRELSLDTLNTMEMGVTKCISKPMKVVTMALKTSTMK